MIDKYILNSVYYATITFCLLKLYSSFQDVEIYMDEVFHVGQARIICSFDFSTWNAKITTFPGLYYLSLIPYLLLSGYPFYSNCTVAFLRAVNIGFALLLLFVLEYCRKQLFPPGLDKRTCSLQLFLIPTNFFFIFLYYTDTASTFFVMLTYAMLLSRRSLTGNAYQGRRSRSVMSNISLFLVALISILVRQTNAVWLMFFVGTEILENWTTADRNRDECTFHWSNLLSFVYFVVVNTPRICLVIWPLLLPVAMFAAFVMVSGSIVVGDKSNHKPTLHLVMPLYLAVVIVFMVLPNLINKYISNDSQLKLAFRTTSWKSVIIGVIGCSLISYRFAYSHPFLLSDNRHFTFYIWQRFLSKGWIRLCLGPVYYSCGYTSMLLVTDGNRRGCLWCIIYLIAVILLLVPSPLLEPRYFTVPAIMAVINMPPQIGNTEKMGRNYLLQTIFCLVLVILNLLLLYVFLYRPFPWHDGSLARFML